MKQTLTDIFEVVRDDDILVVTPRVDLGEAFFEEHRDEAAKLLKAIDDAATRHLVLDFHHTTQFGSTVLGFFVRLWRRVSAQSGRLAMCNLAPNERDMLRLTKLDRLWSLCDTRADALTMVRDGIGSCSSAGSAS